MIDKAEQKQKIYKVKEYIIHNKLNIGIFIIMVAYSLIVCFNFIRPHFPSDAYYISAYGYEPYIKHYLASNRVFCALLFKIYIALNISLTQQMCIMGSFLTLIMSVTWFILYRFIIKLIKKEKSIIYNIITILASFLIVFNMCTAEGLLFVEDGTMPLGVLFSVLGSCILVTNKKRKYLICIALVTISGLLYQGSSSIFVLLSLVFISIKNKNDIKKIIKETLIIGAIYGFAMVFNFIGVKMWSNILNYEFRKFDFPTISVIYNTILKYGKLILIDNCGIGPKYWYLIMILITSALFTINIIRKKKDYFEILEYCTLILLSVLIPIIPEIVTPIEQQYIEPRMAMCFGAIIGILIIYLISILNIEIKKNVKIIIIIISAFNFVANSIFLDVAASSTLEINKVEEIMAKQIIKEILEYEDNTHIEIKGIGIAFDKNYSAYYKGDFKLGCFNARSLGISWAVKEVITTYSGKAYSNVETPDNIKREFSTKDWDFYSEEQLVFDGENLYICIF